MCNMSPFRNCLFCGDVNVFYTMGKSFVLGYVPYVDFVDTKGPILILIYAIGYLISPDATFGIYILASFATFFTLLFLYKTSLYFLKDELKSVLVAICCGSLLFFKLYYGYGPRTEQFLLPLIAVQIWLYCTSFEQLCNNRRNQFIFGSFLGCSTAVFFLTKYIYAPYPFTTLCCLIIYYMMNKSFRTYVFTLLFVYVIAFLLVLLPFFAYFIYTDSLDSFFYAYFTLSSEYVSGGGYLPFGDKLIVHFSNFFVKCVREPVFWIALCSTMCLFTTYYKERMDRALRVVCILSSLALIAVCCSGFWSYYLLMCFPLAIFPIILIVNKISCSKRLLYILSFVVVLCSLAHYILILTLSQSQAIETACPSWCRDYHKVEDIIRSKEHAKILYLDQLDQGFGIKTGAVPACPFWFSWRSINDKGRDVQKAAIRNRVPDFICTHYNLSDANRLLLSNSGYKVIITVFNFTSSSSACTIWSKY